MRFSIGVGEEAHEVYACCGPAGIPSVVHSKFQSPSAPAGSAPPEIEFTLPAISGHPRFHKDALRTAGFEVLRTYFDGSSKRRIPKGDRQDLSRQSGSNGSRVSEGRVTELELPTQHC